MNVSTQPIISDKGLERYDRICIMEPSLQSTVTKQNMFSYVKLENDLEQLFSP